MYLCELKISLIGVAGSKAARATYVQWKERRGGREERRERAREGGRERENRKKENKGKGKIKG